VDALIRGLDNPKAAGVQVQVHEIEVPALSVQTFSPNIGSRKLICS
jgi:hypothetical protein